MRFYVKLHYDEPAKEFSTIALYRTEDPVHEYFDKRTLEWTPDAHPSTNITRDALVDEVSEAEAMRVEAAFRTGLDAVPHGPIP